MKPYKTVRQAASDEFIINKSRFIGYASPAEAEEEALAFLQSIRQKHKDANHNCYAYVIGLNAGIMRYNDDGEPGGTAGLPIMEVLKARGVVNVCVVVTRYFGGILLGAGGLVRAYTQGVRNRAESSGGRHYGALRPLSLRGGLSSMGSRASRPAFSPGAAAFPVSSRRPSHSRCSCAKATPPPCLTN